MYALRIARTSVEKYSAELTMCKKIPQRGIFLRDKPDSVEDDHIPWPSVTRKLMRLYPVG